MDPAQLIVGAIVVLAVVAFVGWPLLERKSRSVARAVDLDRIEARVLEYRAALRRRTLCERCLYPNPDASRFCAQCGQRLPAAAQAAVAPKS